MLTLLSFFLSFIIIQVIYLIGSLIAFNLQNVYDSIAQWCSLLICILLPSPFLLSLVDPPTQTNLIHLYSDGYWACTYNSLSVTLSANIFGVVVGDEVEDFPWEE
jgi:hypothetical protein